MRRGFYQSALRRSNSKHIPSHTFSTSASSLKATAAASGDKILRLDTINPAVLNVEYAVRGAIPQKADELERKLKKEGSKAAQELGFDKVIYANIGKSVSETS